MNYTFLVSAAFCLIMVGCGKDDGVKVPSKTDLITKAAWKYDDAGLDRDKNGTIDVPLPVAIPVCVTDNTLTFAANGTCTVDEGATTCVAGTPQTASITWSFGSNETILNLGGAGVLGISGQMKIVELTDAKLILSKDTTATLPGLPIPIPVTVVGIFKH